MRRIDREMPRAFAYEVIDRCTFATLSLITEDGAPYGVPITIVRDGYSIYFHCAHDGRKVDALHREPRVCLSCVGDTRIPPGEFTTEYESAIVFGRAQEVTDEHEKELGLYLLCERHTPDNMGNFSTELALSLTRTAVWRVDIDEVTAKRKRYDSDGQEMKFGRME